MKARPGRIGKQHERRTQRGAIVLPLIAALMVGLVLLGAAQMGQYFSLKRELQTTADLAALAGAAALEAGDQAGCQQAQAVARSAVGAQAGALGNVLTQGQVEVHCGAWSTAQAGSPGRFTPALPAGAVQVLLSQAVRPIFPFLPAAELRVAAVADTGRPEATFSVGSRLVALKQGGLLYGLLRSAGLSAGQLNVLDAAGLVSAYVTPADLLEALNLPPTVIAGVGTTDALAQLDAVNLGHLLEASLTLLAQQRGLGVDVSALEVLVQLLLGLDGLDVPIRLFGTQGVIAIADDVNPLAALNAQVSLADLLSTSLLLANGSNLIDLNLEGLPGAGLFNQALDIRVRVVEPPSVVIGGVGATANSAGVRVYLRLETNNLPAVGPVLNVLNTRVSLPLIIELSQAQAELMEVCPAGHPDRARMGVTLSVVNVCMGKFSDSDFFSMQHSCADEVRSPISPHEVLNVLGILPLKSKLNLSLLGTSTPLVDDWDAPETKVVALGSLPLDQAAKVLADTVVAGVLGGVLSSPGGMGGLNAQQKGQMAASLVGPGWGRSVSQVVAQMQWSQDRLRALGQTMAQNGLIGVLGGTLTFVDQLLTTLLAAPLSDTVCLLADLGGQSAGNQCRRNAVESLVLRDSHLTGAILSVAVALLEPVLQALSTLLNSLLQTLGVGVMEADVALHDVQCGQPYLVQ